MNEQKNQIEVSARRNIVDAFLITKISWYGNMEQPSFLSRLFDLSSIPSFDHRHETAEGDIYQHTVMNEDWPDEWIFTDSRFNLLNAQDQQFLNFLCLTIHPVVRDDQNQITTLLEIYNNNLSEYGFEIIEGERIAGRPLFIAKTIVKAVRQGEEKSKEETKLALVIGCSKYNYAVFLKNPVNDANSMGKKLQSLGFDVIKSLNPTQKELKSSIDDFGEKLQNYDVGLFYFAGHGVQVKGLNYLIPADANLTTEKMVEYDCVEANRVLSYMEDNKTKVNVIILDACRDNPFERSWSRGIKQRGLTTINAPMGSLIAYSTAPGNTASDGNGENGLYTEALLKHIDSRNVPIISMFQAVRKEVLEKSRREQTPWESTSLTDDYFLCS